MFVKSLSSLSITSNNSVTLVRERTIPTERPPPVCEASAIFCGCRGVVRLSDPYCRNLDFLDRSRYFFFQVAHCTHEAEWTPFQTHYFSDNEIAPGIEPGPLMCSREL
jgi:hypothetical protein